MIYFSVFFCLTYGIRGKSDSLLSMWSCEGLEEIGDGRNGRGETNREKRGTGGSGCVDE